MAYAQAEVYDISLDADLVLTGLLYVSPNGPESGTQVAYADYVVRGKARYPATMRICPGARAARTCISTRSL